MIRNLLAIVVYICCLTSISAYAFNDKTTHKKLTEKAVKPPYSNIDNYLIQCIGYTTGVYTTLNGIDRNGYNQKYNITDWLKEGSEDEDALNICRASNHFHDPIRPGDWMTSQMSDSGWVDALCGTSKRYSDITWATGYVAPDNYFGPRTGQYLGLTGRYNAPQDMGWDTARIYLYSALTFGDPTAREAQFVRTFKAVGQVLHLLQDMAVPAHVRNDMQSHLFNNWNPNNWSNPFEKYVVANESAISLDPSPYKPTLGVSPRVTDFWDKDVYTGTIPSAGTNQGLAEVTNANYYSDSTIPQNAPSASHRYPYPQISNGNNICIDSLPGSGGRKTKYVSRQPCPTYGSPVDHFAAVSLINRKGTVLPATSKVWLDNNVHDTYAREILPRAVGYSAALLDYFFRGKLKITTPSVSVNGISLNVANDTPAENMTSGEVALVVRYRALTESGTGTVTQLNSPPADFTYKIVKKSGVDMASPQALAFTFTDGALPIFYGEMAFQLVYRGQLGNELDAVALSPWVPVGDDSIVAPVSVTGITTDLDVSIPASAIYAKTENDTFTELGVNVSTALPGGLSGGTFELVIEYRTATSDPFQSQPVATTPAGAYSYLGHFPLKSGASSLTAGSSADLVFDLSAAPISINSTSVELFVIYKKNNQIVAYGLNDIPEPTPVDVFNNTDMKCINQQWYIAGSLQAIALSKSNVNGSSDLFDPYPHGITNIYYKISPLSFPSLASSSNYTFSSPAPLTQGSYRRLGYVLSDAAFSFHVTEQWIDTTIADDWVTYGTDETFQGSAIKNQNDRYPGMWVMRGHKMWHGTSLVYDNEVYPESGAIGTSCTWQSLPIAP